MAKTFVGYRPSGTTDRVLNFSRAVTVSRSEPRCPGWGMRSVDRQAVRLPLADLTPLSSFQNVRGATCHEKPGCDRHRGRRAVPLVEAASVSDRIVPVPADLLNEADLERVIQTADNHWGRIDVLVNNAGAFAQHPLEEINQQLVTSLFTTNVMITSLLKACRP